MTGVSERPIGRELELDAIDALLDRTAEGRAGGLLFTGEPGIGKTTLIDHARREATARGWLVLSARGSTPGSEHPFEALAGLLRPLEAAIGAQPDAVASSLRVALGLEVGATETPLVGAALLRLLGATAATQPTLLALDDVNGFDASSVAALQLALRQLDADRVATVAAAETTESASGWGSPIESRALGGLDPGTLPSLVADLQLSPAVVDRCHELTLGNPLGFVELARSLSPTQRAGVDPLPSLAMPGRAITAAFRARLHRLPESAQRALTVAAADETGLVAVIRDALERLGESADLEPAEEADIITVSGPRLAFTHPLLRAAAYHHVAPASRRAAHRALAAALDQPQHAEHRAWQLAAAATGPDERVGAALALVGESAAARGATLSAARILEQAAALTPEPGRAAPRLADAGALWLMAGDLTAAGRALDGARELRPDAVPVEVVLWSALVERWSRGPRVAATNLASAVESADPGRRPWLADALADELWLARGGAPVAYDSPTDGAVPAPVADRAAVRAARTSLRALPGSVAPVVELIAPLVGRSPLALDAAALVAAARFDAGQLIDGLHELVAELAIAPTGIPAARLLAEVELARLEGVLGRHVEARDRLDRAGEEARRLGLVAVEEQERRARALHALGRTQFAEAVTALAPLGRSGADDPHALAADHVEALVGAGRAVDQPGWEARVAELPAAATAREEGMVLRARGLSLGDAAPLEQAVHLHRDLPFEHARSLLLLADHHRRAGSSTSARSVAEEAVAGFERLGATPWAERAGGVAIPVSAGPAVDHAAATALALLTAAELRVAVSVGQGRSNREAAEELFLSTKTVDHHLQHIYRKLALRGRAELAVLVTRGTA